jgi:hypothetical protein
MTSLAALEQQMRTAIDAGDEPALKELEPLIDAADAAARKPTPTMLQAALWYASIGLHVFPLQPLTKIPFKGSNGCKNATDDPDTIKRWWRTTPNANIGIATGHLVDVVDIDGTPGQVSRARNAAIFDSLTILGTVSTPRPGGTHLYVPAAGVGNTAAMLPGVDYRGQGGYVVCPPSVNDQGSYTWTRTLEMTT